MDDTVSMVFARIIIKSCLEGSGSLIECLVAYGMQFYLKAKPVGFLAEFDDLLVRVIENAIATL